jgi:hypothetical protein
MTCACGRLILSYRAANWIAWRMQLETYVESLGMKTFFERDKNKECKAMIDHLRTKPLVPPAVASTETWMKYSVLLHRWEETDRKIHKIMEFLKTTIDGAMQEIVFEQLYVEPAPTPLELYIMIKRLTAISGSKEYNSD